MLVLNVYGLSYISPVCAIQLWKLLMYTVFSLQRISFPLVVIPVNANTSRW
jgi:hypothetical protein